MRNTIHNSIRIRASWMNQKSVATTHLYIVIDRVINIVLLIIELMHHQIEWALDLLNNGTIFLIINSHLFTIENKKSHSLIHHIISIVVNFIHFFLISYYVSTMIADSDSGGEVCVAVNEWSRRHQSMQFIIHDYTFKLCWTTIIDLFLFISSHATPLNHDIIIIICIFLHYHAICIRIILWLSYLFDLIKISLRSMICSWFIIYFIWYLQQISRLRMRPTSIFFIFFRLFK